MRINFSSLKNRILLRFIFLLIISIILILFVTLDQTYEHSQKQLNKQFNVSRSVLLDKLSNDSRSLYRGIAPVSRDFSLKQMVNDVATDSASLLSFLNNQQRRLKTNFMAVLSNDEITLVSNIETAEVKWPIEQLRHSGINLYALNNTLYLLRAVPVRLIESSAKIDAWLVTGVEVNKIIKEQLKAILGFDTTIIYDGKIEASTYDDQMQASFEAKLVQLSKAPKQNISLDKVTLTSYQFEIPNNTNTHANVLFTINKDEAFVNYKNLLTQLSLALVITLLLTFVLSYRFAKSIAKPLTDLADVARDIQKGEYGIFEHNTNISEVNTLSHSLSGMQTAIQLREKENHQLAFFSSLTGLPNRNNFLRKVNQLIDNKTEKFAVLLMDIDRFKDINDTLGHEYGDKVLQTIAHKLDKNRPEHSYLSYLDGDEFSLIFPYNDDPLKQVNQVAKIFEQVFEIENVQLDIATSIGVALYPEHATKVDELMQFADIALYECKTKHESFELFHKKLNTYSVLRLNLMSELRGAIESNQLKLYYQPKIDVVSKRVVSVECLVRWQHPVHGFIFPDDFIPLAEQTGAIRDLTKWAIDEALAQHNILKQGGDIIRMAVNISALDLIDLNLPSYVTMMLKKHNVTADMLTLEVTESAIMADPEKAITALAMLREMGVKLSIDDFGTGYSSMEQLKRTPVHELKIDKSFVLELVNNKEDAIIVKSIADLAHNLGLTIVAEGVEEQKSLDMLEQFNIETAQGYFISKPIDADAFMLWLDNYAY